MIFWYLSGKIDVTQWQGIEIMKRVFGIYGKKDTPSCDVIFDKDWKRLEGTLAELDVKYGVVGVFRPKADVTADWFEKEGNGHFLWIGRTVFTALDVMNGEASEHVEKVWRAWDQ